MICICISKRLVFLGCQRKNIHKRERHHCNLTRCTHTPVLKMYLIILIVWRKRKEKKWNYAEQNQLDDTIIIYIIHKNISKLFANDDLRDERGKKKNEKRWYEFVMYYCILQAASVRIHMHMYPCMYVYVYKYTYSLTFTRTIRLNSLQNIFNFRSKLKQFRSILFAIIRITMILGKPRISVPECKTLDPNLLEHLGARQIHNSTLSPLFRI